MRAWPPISDPRLLERLALDQPAFLDYVRELIGSVGPREYDPALLGRALGYPWDRPSQSYVLRDGDVSLLDELAPDARRATVDDLARDRHPILAIGSNGAPKVLAAKFAHFDDAADRTVMVLAGALHDVDVGPAASPTIYGVLPATLFASPGTAVRAALLWVTPAQVTQLTWSEMSYRLVRLDRARFVMDEADVEVDDLFAYVSRFGVFAPEGAPLALGAIPAQDRAAAAWTQEELLDDVAGRALGAGSRAEDLIRASFEDMPRVLAAIEETIWPLALPFDPAYWTPLPATA
jgi:hypothetical protein